MKCQRLRFSGALAVYNNDTNAGSFTACVYEEAADSKNPPCLARRESIMKNKILTAMLGTAAAMIVMTGCDQKSTDTDLETVEIAAIESMTETDTQQTELIELDLAELTDETGMALEVSTGDLVESELMTEITAETTETTQKANSQKPGEEETELHQKETGTVKKDNDKKENIQKETVLETETESETELVTEAETESETALETEVVTESATEIETEFKVEAETETETESELETEFITEVVTETESETELVTEAVTETKREIELETKAETELVTETATETESEPEPETEAVTEIESETELETESVTETETEIEIAVTDYRTVSDRVNVRQEANTESDVVELLVPGKLLTVLEEAEEWSHIQYQTADGEKEGYVKTEFLAEITAVYEASENVNVRKTPSTDAEKLDQLKAGDRVVIIIDETVSDESAEANVSEEQNEPTDLPEWVAVHYSSDEDKLIEGYVKSEFLNPVTLKELLKELEESTLETSDEEQAAETSEQANSNEPEASETENSEITLSYGLKGQLELLELLFPECTNVGIIYSAEDKGAVVQLTEYEALAETYGLELQTAEIQDAADIDLAASVLVDSVDGILCLDDETVNDLVSVICAYAEETALPVIGISEEQAAAGCVAAYDGKKVIWNQAEAKKFELSAEALNLMNEIIYKD